MPLTSDNWNVNADGDWATASNWSAGVPTSNNSATINTADFHTVTHNSGNDTVGQLTVSSNDLFVLNGGSLSIQGSASFAAGYTQTGGTLNAHAVAITGAGTLIGGSSTGATAFSIAGTIALANYTLAGATFLTNNSTVNQTGNITVGDNTGVNATIKNVAGATYAIAGDYGISAGATSALLNNGGMLNKSAGSGTSAIAVNTTSTGTIRAMVGNLQFSGASNTIGGTVTGVGQVSFTGGVTTLSAGSLTVGTLGIYQNAVVNLGRNETYAGIFNDSSNGTNTLGLGSYTLTLSGSSNTIAGSYGSAIVTGSGTLANSGKVTVGNTVFGGTAKLANTGTVRQTGNVTFGDGSGSVPSLTNSSSGTYTFLSDSNIGENNAAVSFTNQGTLSKTAGTGTSDVSLLTTNSGTINVATGIIEFDNSLTNTGTISGAGALEIGGGGTATLNAGTTLSVATLDLFSTATLNIGTPLTYAGVFNDSSNGTDRLNVGGNTFTLSNASDVIAGNYGSAIVTGTSGGSLANTGTVQLSNVLFGGSVAVSNSGTLRQTGNITYGDGSGNVPSLTNMSSGTYTFMNDSNISENNALVSFTNQGTLSKTGGSGVSDISLVTSSSGTINVATGTIEFDNSLTNTGTISGAGALEIGGGVATLNAGSSLTVGTLDLFNTATLNIGTPLTYAGVFNDASSGTNHLLLGTNTLTLSNAADTIYGSFGSAVVGGSGTLANTGTLSVSNMVIDNTAKLSNSGTVNQVGNVTIGGGAGQIASIVNNSGATYNMAAGYTIGDGAAPTSHFDNSGTFNVNAGTGSAFINTVFTNKAGATVNVATGALENDGTFTSAGAITGTRFVMSGTSVTTFNPGTALKVSEIDMFGQSRLTLNGSFNYANTFNDSGYGSTTIDLKGNQLTLSGASNFSSTGSDIITGTAGSVLKIANASTFASSSSNTVGGSAKLEIASTVSSTGGLQIGDSSPNTASMVIDANGTYNLLTDAGISHGSSAASTLTNNGLFEKTAGTGTSVISSLFVNNGTLTVTSGTIEFVAGTYSGSGVINGSATTDGSGNMFVSAHASA